MTNKEAREILLKNRPDKPQKTEKRQLQSAIDVAVETIDAYENLLKLISIDIGGIPNDRKPNP